jgi:hypothetical protein
MQHTKMKNLIIVINSSSTLFFERTYYLSADYVCVKFVW